MARDATQHGSREDSPGRGPAPWVFGILLVSAAFYWHFRDWNTGSRLMLTYALVDRGTITLDGLEDQTGDRAEFRGHAYTDKLPGYSLLAVPAYALAKAALHLPDHPRHAGRIGHWPADYWVTLATAGLATAGAGAILTILAGRLGCGPRRSALVGLAYGLATPAHVYATLAYGHQLTAFALIGAFALIWTAGESRRMRARLLLAGVLAATASVIELQVGPVSAILGLYVLALVAGRRLPATAVGAFVLGAVGPTLVLLGYNRLAFGSAWDMGYFHHAVPRFAAVHSAGNPLGLRGLDWGRAYPLLFGRHRGLFAFAPIVAMAVPGFVAMAARRWWGVAAVSASACGAIFLVSLSYPEWTGGWTTGPRFFLPMLPFAMLGVAALLAVGGRPATATAIGLGLAGGVLMLLFQGVGGRIPETFTEPMLNPVWRLWQGDPLPDPWFGDRFDTTVLSWAWPDAIARLPEPWRRSQFLPLVLFQALAIAMTLRACRARPTRAIPP